MIESCRRGKPALNPPSRCADGLRGRRPAAAVRAEPRPSRLHNHRFQLGGPELFGVLYEPFSRAFNGTVIESRMWDYIDWWQEIARHQLLPPSS